MSKLIDWLGTDCTLRNL